MACAIVGTALGVVVPGAAARGTPQLDWAACGIEGYVADAECATAELPLDYQRPRHGSADIFVARVPAKDQANKIGALFINPGGPGAGAADFTAILADSLLATLNERFDLIGFDPRGTGNSTPSIDCEADQRTEGIYSVPFPTPETVDPPAFVAKAQGYVAQCEANNPGFLPYMNTGNTARDMDRIRAALGEETISYLGFSYGTFLGTTYESLFPDRVRAFVLDGALDADQYINKPIASLNAQSAGFDRAFNRFFQACAADQAACLGFGGTDPRVAFDELVEQADASPIPASTGDPVTGDDILNFVVSDIYSKGYWPEIAQGLSEAAAGDASLIRFIVDVYVYGLQDDGSYDPGSDRYFVLSAIEQKFPTSIAPYFEDGDEAWQTFDYAWWNTGYTNLSSGLLDTVPVGRYSGPFSAPEGTPTLVVGTTYDPATPYRGSRRLVRELGNARLLTMRGDGHTAYGGNSACIDSAVDAYLLDLTVPAAGTTCRQEVPFAQPEPAADSVIPLATTVARDVRALRPGRW